MIQVPVNLNVKNQEISSDERSYYASLLKQTDPLRAALLSHPVYTQINDLAALQLFMESHVFAVWDFMTLIKTLQQRLTCIDTPWLPPSDPIAARFVNEIVLAEESDEVSPGFYTSHFGLYLLVMEEVGANCQPIHDFIAALCRGIAPERALAPLPIPNNTKQFVLNTLHSAESSTYEVAAAFLLGREDVIPAMFRRLIIQVEQNRKFSCNAFRLYLNRHTDLDEESHAPMGQKLLKHLCATDRDKWEKARIITDRALQSRIMLWDGIAEAIAALPAQR